jgi:hypothetical protein
MFTQNLFGMPKSGVNAYRSSTQSINNITTTTLLYASEEFDYNSEYDPSTGIFTPLRGMMVGAAVCITPSIATLSGKVWQTYLVATNATSGAYFSTMACGATVLHRQTVDIAKQFSLSQGDTIKAQVYQDSGGALNTSASGTENSFSIMEI